MTGTLLSVLLATIVALLAPASGGVADRVTSPGIAAPAALTWTTPLRLGFAVFQGAQAHATYAAIRPSADPQPFRAQQRKTTHRSRALMTVRAARSVRLAFASYARRPRRQEPAQRSAFAFQAHAPPA